MRSKSKTVYYCDHCSRHGLSRAAMEKHERYCTLNPDRFCRWRLLEYDSFRDGVPSPHQMRRGLPRWLRLKSPLTGSDIDSLREHVHGCPACMLAALRQSGIKDIHYGAGYERVFDFDEEVKRYREEEREQVLEEERREIESSWL